MLKELLEYKQLATFPISIMCMCCLCRKYTKTTDKSMIQGHNPNRARKTNGIAV